jgi:glucose-6-phosphate 1-dehydrogenase
MVLFGATGDLARKKLIAVVYDLFRSNLLAQRFHLLGVDRAPIDLEEFRATMREAVINSEEVPGFDEEVWQRFSSRLSYVTADLTHEDAYRDIAAALSAIEGDTPSYDTNRLFYLSVPPFVFEPIVSNLANSGLARRTHDPKERPWARVIVEKPFGDSLRTAQALSQLLLGKFSEHQIFRIDHYLGKETVQNILVFRAANAIFEPIWNRNHIASVQITAAETYGVEQRGGYYDRAGVVRDMFQNHLLQLLALTAMELPVTMNANAVRDEKVKVLRAVRPLGPDAGTAVRAQYAEGAMKGKVVAAYRDEPNIAPDSNTPTYAAVRMMIDNGRWRDVPFYLRSGKRMAKRVTEISVEFRVPPYLIHGLVGPSLELPVEPNVLTLRVQPNDGITLRFSAKIPGAAAALTPEIEVTSVDMDFSYAAAFGAQSFPAYETLLLDCMLGDATLFTRSDEVETGWRITDPLLDYWAANPPKGMPTYSAGTWGPHLADVLLAKDGFKWRTP